MPSRKAVGAAPLVTGIVLASQSPQAIVQSGLSLWSVLAVIGGCATIFVGLGLVLGWNAPERDPPESADVH